MHEAEGGGVDDQEEWVLSRRYRMGNRIGGGGMGELYSAYDSQLERQVAVKLLLPSSPPAGLIPGSPEDLEFSAGQQRDAERFLREVRTTARLELSGIPAIYNTGVDEYEGPAGKATRTYLVMQYLDGRDVEKELARMYGARILPPVSWAAAIGAQIAATLIAVHQVHVVHRDIKPANIQITGSGHAKLLDFGVAIFKGAGAPPRLTQIDHTVGSPGYMSPEQAMALEVGPASDIYGLGCTLFRMLTHRLPYEPDRAMRPRQQHVSAPVPGPGGFRHETPPTLDDLVRRMLAKEADQRPVAEEVYESLLPFAGTPCDEAFPTGTALDPTLPFRRPLVSAARKASRAASAAPISVAEANLIKVSAEELTEAGRHEEAISLLKDVVARVTDSISAVELRHLLAEILFRSDQFAEAAALYDGVRNDYSRLYLRAGVMDPADPAILDCAYFAGQAYAALPDAEKAISRLRYFVDHADPDAGPEVAARCRDGRYSLAEMYHRHGDDAQARSEFEVARSLYAQAFGVSSAFVRKIDLRIGRER